jgi:hypothetical protein
MGIKFEFDDTKIRDVPDVQAALIIMNVLETLEIEFNWIKITMTTDDENVIQGIDKENWK